MKQAGIRDHIRFILNGEDVSLSAVSPEETLLDYLRIKRSLRGTKEGCAEGDCGACTVLVGRLAGGELIYEGVNACIRFLGSLEGCHVVTIEHLAGRDGRLHPVQQALVDHHGSQCGFCTPGIVMSLYALWMRQANPSDRDIERALQGNLCRCTGYQSIMRAARAFSTYGEAARDPLLAERGQVAERLAALRDGRRIEIGRDGRRLIIPSSVSDLADVLEKEPGATIVAGSTDVGLWVTKFMRGIGPAVFLGSLEELKTIAEQQHTVRIGAAVTYSEASDALVGRIPALEPLLYRIGGDQIRNMGTIGGNIANGSPIGDMPPPLIALGASVVLRRGARRRVLPLEEFFIAYGKQDRSPGEFVEAIEVPLPSEEWHFAVHKVSKRRDEDITAVLGAFCLNLAADGTVSAIRIAYGGMAAIPKRARAVEAALIGRPWNEASVEASLPAFAVDFSPISDMRASAEYRATVARNLLRRFHLQSLGNGEPLQVSRNEAA